MSVILLCVIGILIDARYNIVLTTGEENYKVDLKKNKYI